MLAQGCIRGNASGETDWASSNDRLRARKYGKSHQPRTKLQGLVPGNLLQCALHDLLVVGSMRVSGALRFPPLGHPFAEVLVGSGVKTQITQQSSTPTRERECGNSTLWRKEPRN